MSKGDELPVLVGASDDTAYDSQYVWLPLTFPTRTTMDMPWYRQISLDTAVGTDTGVGGGPYCNLAPRHSGKCLDVANASAVDGTRLIQWPCGTGANQQLQRRPAEEFRRRAVSEHSTSYGAGAWPWPSGVARRSARVPAATGGCW